MLLRTITLLSALLTAVFFFCSDMALWLLPLLFAGLWLLLLFVAFLILLAFSEAVDLEKPQGEDSALYRKVMHIYIEALISHNEADISTWLPREYEENLTYGQKNSEWSDWTRELREVIKQDSIEKIRREGK